MMAEKIGGFCTLLFSLSWLLGREVRRRRRFCRSDEFSLTWTHPCSIRWIIGNLLVTDAFSSSR